MDVFEAIKSRRSIRAFQEKEIPEEFIEKILDSARWAPSAGNTQPWEFIIVKDKELKMKLAEAAYGQYFIVEAPLVIVVCTNIRKSSSRYGSRGETLYSIQDAAAATQNILLSIHALGLGACWIGAFSEEKVSLILNIPKYVRPVAILPIGYPAEKPSPPSKRRIDEITFFEKYGLKYVKK
ncbi:MAG: nitroreductase family protein [Nitrososphaerota archaeon]